MEQAQSEYVYWPRANSQIDCIIPARGNSKRFPRKNLAVLHGHPLIGLAIESARLSGVFGGVYVSTEDEETGRVAREYGAAVIERPQKLAEDHIQVKEVVIHALGVVDQDRKSLGLDKRKYVGVVYPTAFLLTPEDIKEMYGSLREGNPPPDGVMSLVAPSEHPLGALVDGGVDFWLRPYFGEPPQSQAWPRLWMDAGYCYMYRVEAFVAHGFYPPKLAGQLLHRERVFDIDYPQDLRVAEALMDLWMKRKTQ